MSRHLLTLLFVSLSCYPHLTKAQSTGLNYNTGFATATYGANTGVTVIHAAGIDDAVSGPIPITFKFNFGGEPVTQIWVSSNGWFSFQDPGLNSYSANDLQTATLPIVAPLWDNLKVAGTGNVNYKFFGGNPNKQMRIEWLNMLWSNGASTYGIDFQVWLYQDSVGTTPGNGSKIEFRYRRNSTAGAGNQYLVSPSASIGIAGFCAGDFYADSISGSLPSTTFQKDTDLAVIGFKPNNNQLFSFSPQQHPNDWAANAEAISLQPGKPLQQYDGTTLHATWSNSVSLPVCWNTADTFDVWFAVTKPAGITNFELFADQQDCRGAIYKVKMAVYADTTAAPIACDGTNSGGVAGAMSSMILTGQPCAQTVYYVRVGSAKRVYFRFNVRPPGRNCAYATDITPCGIPYNSPPLLSTCEFVNDYDSANAACHSSLQTGEDYVFAYTPASSGCINVSLNNTPPNSNPGLYIYRDCPTLGACLGSIVSTGGSALTFNSLTLAAGYTYYFVVDYDSLTTPSCLNSFDLTITSSGSPPSYDLCTAPAAITPLVGSPPCTGTVTYNNNCATPSLPDTIITPNPGCGIFTAGITPDVWFTFTATNTQPHQIVVNEALVSPAQDLAMAVYTGSCTGFTLVSCDDNTNGLMPSLAVSPPSAGTVYYIRIFSNDGTPPGSFNICIRYGCTPPNDLCINAILLTNGQPVYGDNSCSTGTNEPLAALGGPTCWRPGNTMNTVWYKFVATNTTMKIKTQLLTLYNSQIALYDGPCGSVMTERYCNDNFYWCNGAQDRNSQIVANGLTVGNTYYISVDGRAAGTGTFTIMVVDGASSYPPQYAQDCITPIALCSNATISVPNPGWVGEGNICDVPQGSSNTCMLWGERRGVWYTFTIDGGASGQTLQFEFTPNNVINHDWMLWAIDTIWNNNPNHVFPTVSNYCSQLTNEAAFPLVVCNASLYSPTGCNTSAGTINIPPTAGPSVLSTTSNTFCCHGRSPAVFIPANCTVTFLLSHNHAINLFESGYTLNWLGSAISSSAPSATWVNQVTVPSAIWDGVSNAQAWVPNCYIPNCSTHPIAAFIAPGGIQPVITTNVDVKDLTISAGALLTINAGATLSICGNFTNNGTLACQPGSVVKFVGNTNTSISGTFAQTGNTFYNVQFAKSTGASVTLNTNIYIHGYDSITSGIVNNNSMITEVGGNFYNYNGSTSYTGVGSGVAGSALIFTGRNNGGATQWFRNDGSALTLNNVIINQVTPSAVRLNAGASSNMILGTGGMLTLTSGRIITTAAAAREVSVTNNVSLACSPGNSSSYVEGNLRRSIGTTASSYDFPVGDGTSVLAPGIVGYERANLTFTTAPTAPFTLLAAFYRWSLGGVAFPGNGPAASECVSASYDALPYFNHGYWRINAGGAASGTYRINLYNSGMNNNTGMGWTVVKAPSGTGTFALSGSCYVASTAAQTRRDNLSGFSDFATVQSQAPLPIELLHFNALPDGENVICSWSTATEINNDYFTLERSSDFVNFTPVAEIDGFGAGISSHVLHYRYEDKGICNGTWYYRLRQTDIDGTSSLSTTVAVKCKTGSGFTLSPNPVSEKLMVLLPSKTVSSVMTFSIYNKVGEILFTIDKSSPLPEDTRYVEVDVEALPPGIYFLEAVTTGQVFRDKFVKK